MRPHSAIRLPPLVPGWPLLGNAIKIAADPVHFWVETARKYGPAYRVRYPTAPNGEMTVLAGIAANQFATRHGHEVFTTRQYYQKLTREAGTENYICALDGDAHTYFRKVMKPALSREAAGPFVQDMIRMVEAKARDCAGGDVVPVLKFVQRMALDELSLAAAGCPMSDAQFEDLSRFAKTFVGSGVAGRPEFLLRMPGYQRAKNAVHHFLNKMVAQHEQPVSGSEHRADLMDIVAHATYPDGRPFNEADRAANAHLPYANGFIYAGRICALLLYALLKHPAILKRVQAEVDTAFADGIPNAQRLRRMTTLRNCLKETYRRYPVAPAVPRYAAKTFEFEGYTIPAGSYLFIAIVVPHFDERYFPDPYSFDPDRFAPPRSEGARANAYSPYGLGTHVCLSVGLLETVVMTTVVGLLHTLNVELEPQDYELRTTTDPVPGPETGFRIRIAGRRRPNIAVPASAPVESELETALPGLHLSSEELKRFAGGVVRRSYSAGVTIIRQGDKADEFFVVTEGEVEVVRETEDRGMQHLAHIGPGEYFGEIGLLHGVPRTATVRATGNGVTVLAIGQELFTHMAAEHDMVSDEIAALARRRVMVNQLAVAIPGLNQDALARVSAHLERRRFAAGDVVIRQGGKSDRFYVIVAGKAEVVNHHPNGDDIPLGMLGPGDYFGEIGILHNRPRTATVRASATTDLEVLALEREHFLALRDDAHETGQAIADEAMRRLLALGTS